MGEQRTEGTRADGPGEAWWRELGEFFDESVRVYLRLSALAVKMHGNGPLSGPRRTVLVGLSRSGPRTVAQMAREREQPRQRFQPLVNALLADGLVATRSNPAHKQSPLIVLTRKGERAVRRIQQIELAWRPRLHVPVSTAALKDTVRVMQLVRAELERLVHEDAPDRSTRTRRRRLSG